jgi:putative membrane protein
MRDDPNLNPEQIDGIRSVAQLRSVQAGKVFYEPSQPESWHYFEHFCFFTTSLIFRWPIVQPWPTRRRLNSWMIIPYLLTWDFVNAGLSAFPCFSGRLFYPSNGVVERPFGIDAAEDQIAAGAFIWVFGSLVFLVPAIYPTTRFLANGRLVSEKTGLERARALAQ